MTHSPELNPAVPTPTPLESPAPAQANLAPPSPEELQLQTSMMGVVDRAIKYCDESKPVRWANPHPRRSNKKAAGTQFPGNVDMLIVREDDGTTRIDVYIHETSILKMDGSLLLQRKEKPGEQPKYTVGLLTPQEQDGEYKHSLDYSFTPGERIVWRQRDQSGTLEPVNIEAAQRRVGIIDKLIEKREALKETTAAAAGAAVTSAATGGGLRGWFGRRKRAT